MLLGLILVMLVTGGCNSSPESGEAADTRDASTATINASTNPVLFVTVGEKKLAYRSVGEGKPIILCSRFRGNLDCWDPLFLESLASHGYRVITFDHRGLGSSTGAPPENILDFATDVKDLAHALGYKKVIVGGWSLGGWVAQIVTTEFPELVTHTILIGTKPPGKVEYPVEQIFLNTAWKKDYTLEDETILFFEPTAETSRAAAKESHERIAKRTSGHDKFIEESRWECYAKAARDFEADPYQARKKIMTTKIPMLVISADHEVCFPPQNWYNLTRQLPTTQLLVIPQSGHGPQHQYPEFIASYIHQYISEFQ